MAERGSKTREGRGNIAAPNSDGAVEAARLQNGAFQHPTPFLRLSPSNQPCLCLLLPRSLEWVIGDASQFYSGAAAARGADQTTTAASVMAARRMHARLPSISGKLPCTYPDFLKAFSSPPECFVCL